MVGHPLNSTFFEIVHPLLDLHSLSLIFRSDDHFRFPLAIVKNLGKILVLTYNFSYKKLGSGFLLKIIIIGHLDQKLGVWSSSQAWDAHFSLEQLCSLPPEQG